MLVCVVGYERLDFMTWPNLQIYAAALLQRTNDKVPSS